MHETRRIFLSPFISKASRRASSFFPSVQLSQPYVATGHIRRPHNSNTNQGADVGLGDKWPVTPQTAQQQHRQRRRGMRAALVCNCYNWVRPVRTNKPPEWLVETHREENNSTGGGHLGNDGRATAQSLRLIFICLCFIDTGRGRAVYVPCSVNDRRSRLSLKCHHPTEVTFRRGV